MSSFASLINMYIISILEIFLHSTNLYMCTDTSKIWFWSDLEDKIWYEIGVGNNLPWEKLFALF